MLLDYQMEVCTVHCAGDGGIWKGIDGERKGGPAILMEQRRNRSNKSGRIFVLSKFWGVELLRKKKQQQGVEILQLCS
jgi:hypothetical protein